MANIQEDPFQQLKLDAEKTYTRLAKKHDSESSTQLFTAIRDYYENKKYWDKSHDLLYSTNMLVTLFGIQKLAHMAMLDVIREELIAVSLFGYTYDKRTELRVLIEDLDLNDRDRKEFTLLIDELESKYNPTLEDINASDTDSPEEIKELEDIYQKRYELRAAMLFKDRRRAKDRLMRRLIRLQAEFRYTDDVLQQKMAQFEVDARKNVLNLRPSHGRIARNIEGLAIGTQVPRTVQTLYWKIAQVKYRRVSYDKPTKNEREYLGKRDRDGSK
jgi:hypothetical protein